MKLKAQTSGTDHDLVLRLATGVALATVDGREYQLEVRELAGGEYLLIKGAQVYRCRVEREPQRAGEPYTVIVRGQSHEITIVDPKRLRTAQSAGAHQTGAVEIISPMPGKIVRVLVAAGAQVAAGAGVIVMEAMKMQNEMKAPKSGVIISLNAAEGATVNAGDVLAVIE
jgi:biotin carboxyl carrier protein